MSIALDFALFMRNSQTKLRLSLEEQGVAFKLGFMIPNDKGMHASHDSLCKECGVSSEVLNSYMTSLLYAQIIVAFVPDDQLSNVEYFFNEKLFDYHKLSDGEKMVVHTSFGDTYLQPSL